MKADRTNTAGNRLPVVFGKLRIDVCCRLNGFNSINLDDVADPAFVTAGGSTCKLQKMFGTAYCGCIGKISASAALQCTSLDFQQNSALTAFQ